MRRLLAISTVVIVAMLGLAQPAAAHGTLAYSDPAHQSTVATARQQVALYFTEKPAPNAFFSVIAPTGVRVDQGWTHGEPKRLEKPVQEMGSRWCAFCDAVSDRSRRAPDLSRMRQ